MTERIILVYATQTGQSKAIAEDMSDLAKTHGIDIEVHCMSTFGKEFSLEKEKYLLFVASTTGDGDPPDTAIKFWRSLKRCKEKLDHLCYALLGLGDTNHTNFCNFGKMLDRRLQEMSAEQFHASMWADDAVGLETVADVWMNQVVDKLLEIFGKKRVSECWPVDIPTTSSSSSEIASSTTTAVSTTRLLASPSSLTTKPLSSSLASLSIFESISVNHNFDPSENGNPDNLSPIETLHSLPREPIESGCFQLTRFSINLMNDAVLQLPSSSTRFLQISPQPILHVTDTAQEGTYPTYFKESNYFFLPSSRTQLGLATIQDCLDFTEGKDGVKEILKLCLDIRECGWNADILPGDTVGIICPNNEQEVDDLLILLGIDESQKSFKARFHVLDKAVAMKKRVTFLDVSIVELLTWHVDIRSFLKKAFLRSLVEVTEDKYEKRVLEVLCSREGSDDYRKIFVEERMNILNLLKLLPSCKPSLGCLYEHLPKLLPRPYSICSSQFIGNETISIVFSVSQFETTDCHRRDKNGSFVIENDDSRIHEKMMKKGLCTGWLYDTCLESKHHNYEPPIKLAVYLRNSTQFRLVDDLSVPLILIGPGTGVSPFIGFLQQRSAQIKASENKGKIVGETWLFFGCRGRNDFIFKRDIEEFKSSGVLTELQVCFSRESRSNLPRYVQDNMLLHGKKLASLIIHNNAKIYVCGDAKKITLDVNNALKQILQEHSDLDTHETDLYYARMRTDKRIVEDVWT